MAAGVRRNLGGLVSVAVAAAVLLAAVGLGPVDGSNSTLVGLGFDPDRAQLITALIVGGTAAVLAYMFGGVRWAAAVAGFAAMAALFGPTFARETHDAQVATGAAGAFDEIGWTESLLAFVVIGLVTAWACAACAMPLRREVAGTARAVVVAARQRPFDRRSWNRPIAALLVIGLLAVTLPVAGDLFNYGADTRMTVGGSPRPGLVPQDQGLPGGNGVPVDLPSSTPIETATGSAPPSASPTPTATPTPLPTALPWKSSPPSGLGRMVYLAFNAPWVDPGAATEEVAIYLPPGYDTNASKRYPAVYEAPFLFNLWNSAFNIKGTLDALITEGQIPPTMFVFMNSGGGPFADTQCADTWDGREKMDRFLGISVPTYIDKHYRTIAKPSARAVMGMSEGGYCAAILALHHPDVFGTALSFSGYFTAGLGSASAPIPFGNNPTLIKEDSPIDVAPTLAAAVKSGLYFVIVAQTDQVFYGSQAADFMDVLQAAGIKYSYIAAPQPHGWPQVRDSFDAATTLVAIRQAELGVLG